MKCINEENGCVNDDLIVSAFCSIDCAKTWGTLEMNKIYGVKFELKNGRMQLVPTELKVVEVKM